MYSILENCGSVIVVCKNNGKVVNVYGVLKNCGSVIVICEYDGSGVGIR
jgi:hypothetical protein